MKDTRFIELVNLYIDRQIEPADAAELEAAIQADPHRRQVYLEYCRMHRATKLAYESFRVSAIQPADGKLPGTVERFEARRPRPRRVSWFAATAGLAAAASFAFLVVRENSQKAPANGSGSQIIASQPAVAPVAVAQTPVAAPTVHVQPPTAPVRETDYTAMLAALRREDQRAFALTQSASLQAQPLFDDGVFGPSGNMLNGSGRMFPNQVKTDNHTSSEFTAFQFQR